MDGVNFDINNSGVRRAIALNKVYGIEWRELKQIGDRPLMPVRGRKPIYFTTARDALKVANFLNEVSESKQYSVVSVTYDSLMKAKEVCLANNSIQKDNPIAYHNATEFRLYNSASEYFRVMGFGQSDEMEM